MHNIGEQSDPPISAFDRLLELRGHPVVIATRETKPTMAKRIIKLMGRTVRALITARALAKPKEVSAAGKEFVR